MNRIIVLLSLCIIYSCANNNSNVINGTAEGLSDGTKLFLEKLELNNKRVPLDTAIVNAEKFIFDTDISDDKAILLLSTEDRQSPLLFVSDGVPITIKYFKDSIPSSIVNGSVENQLLNSYRAESRIDISKKQKLSRDMQVSQRETDGVMVTMLRKKITEVDQLAIERKKETVDSHPDKLVAAMALSDLINAQALTATEVETNFNQLSADVQNSVIGASLKNYIAQQKSQRIADQVASIGNKAPEFTAPTPDGEQLSLSQTLGEYTIIDFWASWCRPCRMENPNVVNVYKEYHNKGLNIISVSLDRPGQDARWKKAIADDKMDWYHVSNLQFWQDPIAKSYGVRSIPATFLLDKDGVIIAKDLRGPALGAKMEELLGE